MIIPLITLSKTVSSLLAKSRLLRVLIATLLGTYLSSCNLIPPEELQPPLPLELPKAVADGQLTDQAGAENEQAERTKFERVAQTAIAQPSVSLLQNDSDELFAADEEAAISLSVDGLPLPAFINEVFANQLSLDFEMAPDVANKKDLVTLRVTEARNRQGIFTLSRKVLANYGVLIIKQDGLLRFVLGTSSEATFEPPLIVTGSALPSVPSTHRPVFLIRSLNVIGNADAYSMLRKIFDKQSITIERDNTRNAVSLQGSPELVKSAANVLDMLDVPKMKGQYSLRIEPVYTDVATLAENLIATMGAQGFDIGASSKNTTLIPIKELNALFVYAPNEKVLAAVRQWVGQLDRVAEKANKEDGFYWYRVKNTGAEHLADVMNAVLGGGGAGVSSNLGAKTNDKPAEGDRLGVHGNFVVDPARNMLLFRGKAERWQEIMPLIQELDVAPPQVMVEVVVAEVSLKEDFSAGIEWAMKEVGSGQIGNLSSVFGPDGVGSGIAAKGLQWASLSSSGMTRIALSAFASDNRVSILQTPKVLVRSGETASVNVGQKVPIITSRTAEEEVIDGDSAVSQQIEYRDIGIKLEVTPTVFSGGRIDMAVSQEVSASLGDASELSLTPIITSRNVSTKLSLSDGGSVLLGGLISKNQSKGNSRVPLLGDIPWLGQLFRFDSTQADRTELMILIVPYLIAEPGQAEALTRSFREQLSLHPENN